MLFPLYVCLFPLADFAGNMWNCILRGFNVMIPRRSKNIMYSVRVHLHQCGPLKGCMMVCKAHGYYSSNRNHEPEWNSKRGPHFTFDLLANGTLSNPHMDLGWHPHWLKRIKHGSVHVRFWSFWTSLLYFLKNRWRWYRSQAVIFLGVYPRSFLLKVNDEPNRPLCFDSKDIHGGFLKWGYP